MNREEAGDSLPSLLRSLFAIVARGLHLQSMTSKNMDNENFQELVSGEGDGLILARGNPGKGLNNCAPPRLERPDVIHYRW